MAGKRGARTKKTVKTRKNKNLSNEEESRDVNLDNTEGNSELTTGQQEVALNDTVYEVVPVQSSKKRSAKTTEETSKLQPKAKARKFAELEASGSNTVTLRDGDDLVTITAKGQDTDFINSSDEEEGKIIDDDDEIDMEVTFRARDADSFNNNVTLGAVRSRPHEVARNLVAKLPEPGNSCNANSSEDEIRAAQFDTLKQIQALMTKGGFKDTVKFVENKLMEEITKTDQNKELVSADAEKVTDVPREVINSPAVIAATERELQKIKGHISHGKQEVRKVTICPKNLQVDKSSNSTKEIPQPRNGGNSPTFTKTINFDESNSDITIYRNAVPLLQPGNSSDEVMTSDETDQSNEVLASDESNDCQVDNFVDRDVRKNQASHRNSIPDVQLSTSGYQRPRALPPPPKDKRMQDYFKPKNRVTPEERAENYIREAETMKARMFQAPGKQIEQAMVGDDDGNSVEFDVNRELTHIRTQLHSAIIDQDYESVSSHVDEVIRAKILRGEYTDLAKLLPKDRVTAIDDSDRQTLQLFHKDGQTFYAPPSTPTTAITSFGKWDRAFRIFSNIYLKAHPHRALELNEYIHTIHHISQTYVWDNCYAYDKEFRYFMGLHPERSWCNILQKAWAFRLNEKIRHTSHQNDYFNRHGNDRGRSNYNKTPPSGTDSCKRFNRGKCTYGASCRYEHRCDYCRKFGHGMFNCRKLTADKERDQKPKNSDFAGQGHVNNSSEKNA